MESSLCRFIGNEFAFYYIGGYHGSTVYLTEGKLLVEDCGIDEDTETNNFEDYFIINGGVADLGGGVLGSAGNNDFSKDDGSSYFIKNNKSQNN